MARVDSARASLTCCPASPVVALVVAVEAEVAEEAAAAAPLFLLRPMALDFRIPVGCRITNSMVVTCEERVAQNSPRHMYFGNFFFYPGSLHAFAFAGATLGDSGQGFTRNQMVLEPGEVSQS